MAELCHIDAQEQVVPDDNRATMGETIMPSVNKAIIIGHLGADPEMNQTSSGQSVCNFRVATTSKWKDKDGAAQENTQWHRITAWGRQAELCHKYLDKGSAVYVEGRIQTRDYEDDKGVKRWVTDIVANVVQFLGGRSDGGTTQREPEPPPITNEDIPF